jgi:hypothetical protein
LVRRTIDDGAAQRIGARGTRKPGDERERLHRSNVRAVTPAP